MPVSELERPKPFEADKEATVIPEQAVEAPEYSEDGLKKLVDEAQAEIDAEKNTALSAADKRVEKAPSSVGLDKTKAESIFGSGGFAARINKIKDKIYSFASKTKEAISDIVSSKPKPLELKNLGQTNLIVNKPSELGGSDQEVSSSDATLENQTGVSITVESAQESFVPQNEPIKAQSQENHEGVNAIPQIDQDRLTEIHNPAIRELADPIMKLLWELRDKIEEGSFDSIIGDDSSGRIPALVFSNVINRIYKQKEIPKIDTKFLAGSRGYKEGEERFSIKVKKIVDFINIRLLKNVNDREASKKTLIVTDTIFKGNSLLPLVRALQETHKPYDIATISMTKGKNLGIEQMLGAEIHFAQTEDAMIFSRDKTSKGVYKDVEDIHAKSLKKKEYTEKNPHEKIIIQNAVNEGRADATKLADLLSEAYIKAIT